MKNYIEQFMQDNNVKFYEEFISINVKSNKGDGRYYFNNKYQLIHCGSVDWIHNKQSELERYYPGYLNKLLIGYYKIQKLQNILED